MKPKNIIIIVFLIQTLAFGQKGHTNILDGALVSKSSQPATVQLVNSTGYDIDTLLFYNIFFPSLEKDSSTAFFSIPNYKQSDFVRGSIQTVEIDNVRWYWNCKPDPLSFEYQSKNLIIEIILADSKMLENHYRLETRIKEIIE